MAVLQSVAQTPKIDSLRNKLEQYQTPLEKLPLHHKLMDEFYNSVIYYDSAFYHAKKGYQIAVDENLPQQQISFLFNLAAIYNMVDKRSMALKYYEDCLQLAKQEDFSEPIPAIINNMGDIYMKEKDYKNAKRYFVEALDFAIKKEDKKLEALSYLNIGEVYYYENKFQESKSYFEKSEAIYAQFPPKHVAYSYLMARTYLALNQPETAEEMAQEGYRDVKKTIDYHRLYDYVLLLSNIYTQKEDFKKAVHFNKLAMAYNDSLRKGKDLWEVERLFTQLELQKQKNKLEILQQKNEYIFIIYIIGAVFVLLLIIIISRQLKIIRMTKDIHAIQKSLIEYELDLRRDKK